MPRNLKGGNKAKKGANKYSNQEVSYEIQRPIDNKQKYGVITKVLGNSRFEVETDGKLYQVKLPGKFRRKKANNSITLDTAVLYDSGDLTSNTGGSDGYILCIYNQVQTQILKKEGTIKKETINNSNEITQSSLDFNDYIDSMLSNDKKEKPKLETCEEEKEEHILETGEIDLDNI
tara:strand:+ start:567 stop:1094 length:528 start_codon:yes stop_codon:yes gene_type:complete